MAIDLQAILKDLTGQPSTEHPYLSVYLDMVPDGDNKRSSLLTLRQEFDRIEGELSGRDVRLDDSFNIDKQRILDYIDNEVPIETQGLAIFACDAASIWQPIQLQVQVTTRVIEDRFPHVFELARIVDDYETYGIVLVDGQDARILITSMNGTELVGETEAAEEVKRFQAGGWAQMVFQRRTDNIIKAHTKELADKLGRVIKRYNVQHVIIAGNDSIKGMVLDSLPKPIQDKLVDYVSADIYGNMQEIMGVLEPMMRNVELEQEADDLDQLEAQVNTKGGLGVIGAGPTAMALTKGQVRTLIMHQGFNALGGECANCGTLQAGTWTVCPFDGNELTSVNLREAFTSRALQSSAAIQIVEASEYLDQHDGVGAMLFYRDDVPADANQDQIA